MKDFDFDEIDRAVNSLNANTPAVDDGVDDSIQSNVPPTTPSSPSLPLAGRRSTGQFMDVVHPSSDMRRAPLVMPERANQQSSIPNNNPIIETVNTNVPSNGTSETNSENSWPDPIDFSGPVKDESDNVEKSDLDQTEDADIDRISDDITKELSQKTDDFSDSPFISGTKVEKRPLGAFSTESSVQEVEPSNQSEETITDESSQENVPPNVDKSLPDELQDDLLQIESDDIKPIIEKSDDEGVTATEEIISTEVNQPAPPVSIVQQYKEQPSTGDQSTGAIYDTDAYHKALVLPIKKKSGWMWVLWIFILIVVGVGAGAAVYFYVLPLL